MAQSETINQRHQCRVPDAGVGGKWSCGYRYAADKEERIVSDHFCFKHQFTIIGEKLQGIIKYTICDGKIVLSSVIKKRTSFLVTLLLLKFNPQGTKVFFMFSECV